LWQMLSNKPLQVTLDPLQIYPDAMPHITSSALKRRVMHKNI